MTTSTPTIMSKRTNMIININTITFINRSTNTNVNIDSDETQLWTGQFNRKDHFQTYSILQLIRSFIWEGITEENDPMVFSK